MTATPDDTTTMRSESSEQITALSETLRSSVARLQAILDTAIDAIITIDAHGIINSVNRATERILGYSETELVGRNVSILMPQPFASEHDRYLERYLSTREPRIIGIGREVVARRKDGTFFPVDLAVSEVVGLGLFTGILRDITQRNFERERLIQSERLAALGEAMAGLTHESRNALARSQSNLRMLARRLTDRDDLLGMIHGAMRANEDIRRQFEEVREYAAPIKLHKDPHDLRLLLDAAWNLLEEEREVRAASLKIDPHYFDLTCDVDTLHVQNAFRNIFENSLAACTGETEITVKFCEDLISGRPAIRVSISDNGPGIPADIYANIFDAFFTTKTRGTGLGLAIVKRSVEAHGGRVTAQPGLSGGAEIILTFPRKQE
jgi:two-component system sensor kinase FixL